MDVLIIMGGAVSVNDAADFPWLKVEKAWIRHYLGLQKPVIGLCLGAQLIASALTGAKSPKIGYLKVVGAVCIKRKLLRQIFSIT